MGEQASKQMGEKGQQLGQASEEDGSKGRQMWQMASR